MVGANVSDPTSQNFKILYYNSLLSNSGDCPSGFKGRLEFRDKVRQNGIPPGAPKSPNHVWLGCVWKVCGAFLGFFTVLGT